jgi:tripartite-type tricarboxylate transporter receptor subunit TctC
MRALSNHFFFRRCSLALTLCLASWAFAQDFPNRPITMIMPYAPGGPGDAITRLFAGAMQKTLGQQVVVDNPAGASGSIGTARVARSKPDGYTLLMIHVSHATNLVMFKNLPYHPVQDFEPIGRATLGPMLVVARNGFPTRDLNEWVTQVKARAPTISLAHAGVGSASHLCGLMLMNALGVKFNEIPYKGTGPALNDLAGGQVDLLCDQTSGTVPLIKAGRIRAVAAAGAQRIASLPDMPAFTEVGVTGMDINISFGLYAPKGTPKVDIEKLSKALQAAVNDPELKAKLEAMGVSAVTTDLARPEALRAHLQSEIDVLGGLLVKAGVKPE